MTARARLRVAAVGLAALAVPACRSDGTGNPIREAFASVAADVPTPTSVALRFPVRGRSATLFQLPRLEAVAWEFETEGSPDAIVGFAGDLDLVYTLSPDGDLAALDLTSGRARVVDSGVVRAALGPGGTPLTVRRDGSVARIVRRTATPWADTLPGVPLAVWGAARDRLLALYADSGGRRVELWGTGQRPSVQPIPDGAVQVSAWGDLVVVATDSGVVALAPRDGTHTFRRLDPPPTLVTVTPAAHRVLAVRGDRLLLLERFELQVLDSLTLPGRIAAVRIDPAGLFALLRPASADSVWVVTLDQLGLAASLPGEWDATLPSVAWDGTVLLRVGDRVRAVTPGDWAVAGEAPSPPEAAWLALAWDPRRPALELAADTVVRPRAGGGMLYVQVSSTRNRLWADDLADNLRRAGMNASVLQPSADDEPFRVVLGPYSSREDAEEVGRTLGMPSWIFTLDTTTATPEVADTADVEPREEP